MSAGDGASRRSERRFSALRGLWCVAALVVFVVLMFPLIARPNTDSAIFGVRLAFVAVVCGCLVGLILRHPAVVACLVLGYAGVTLRAVGSGSPDGVAFALGQACAAAAGLGLGSLARRGPRAAVTVATTCVVLAVATFALPPVLVGRSAAAFIAAHGAELPDMVTARLARAPQGQGLDWAWVRNGQRWSRFQLETTWPAPGGAPPGHVSVNIGVQRFGDELPLDRRVEGLYLSYQPDQPLDLRTAAEAKRLVASLGVLLPDQSAEGTEEGWRFGPLGIPPYWHVWVTQDGRVFTRRTRHPVQ